MRRVKLSRATRQMRWPLRLDFANERRHIERQMENPIFKFQVFRMKNYWRMQDIMVLLPKLPERYGGILPIALHLNWNDVVHPRQTGF